MSRQRKKLSEKQLKELKSYYQASRKWQVRTRCQAVWLYGEGRPVIEIVALTGCSRSSLGDWWHRYRQQGVAGLEEHRLGGNSAKLTREQRADLKERLHNSTPREWWGQETDEYWGVETLIQAVEQWYGVRYKSLTSYRTLLKQCGFSFQRPATVYRSRSEAKVVEFEAALEKN